MALVRQKPRLSRPFCQDSMAANLKWLASPRVVLELGRQRLRLLHWPFVAASQEQPIRGGGLLGRAPQNLGAFRPERYRITQDRTTARREINCAVTFISSARIVGPSLRFREPASIKKKAWTGKGGSRPFCHAPFSGFYWRLAGSAFSMLFSS